jgi:hypothetical protein
MMIYGNKFDGKFNAYTGEIDPLFPFEIDPPFGDAK